MQNLYQMCTLNVWKS